MIFPPIRLKLSRVSNGHYELFGTQPEGPVRLGTIVKISDALWKGARPHCDGQSLYPAARPQLGSRGCHPSFVTAALALARVTPGFTIQHVQNLGECKVIRLGSYGSWFVAIITPSGDRYLLRECLDVAPTREYAVLLKAMLRRAEVELP